jgi:hypothetical protein
VGQGLDRLVVEQLGQLTPLGFDRPKDRSHSAAVP